MSFIAVTKIEQIKFGFNRNELYFQRREKVISPFILVRRVYFAKIRERKMGRNPIPDFVSKMLPNNIQGAFSIRISAYIFSDNGSNFAEDLWADASTVSYVFEKFYIFQVLKIIFFAN